MAAMAARKATAECLAADLEHPLWSTEQNHCRLASVVLSSPLAIVRYLKMPD